MKPPQTKENLAELTWREAGLAFAMFRPVKVRERVVYSTRQLG